MYCNIITGSRFPLLSQLFDYLIIVSDAAFVPLLQPLLFNAARSLVYDSVKETAEIFNISMNTFTEPAPFRDVSNTSGRF
jgi:hypothetical protein